MPKDDTDGDSIDRAVNIEMRFQAGLPIGVTFPLFETARNKQKSPSILAAAQLLKDRVPKGRNVFIVTGEVALPGLPRGETDGPPGAAVIARAIEIGLDARLKEYDRSF